MPASQRGAVYAGSLPEFMKPPADSSSAGATPSGDLPLPPPPPRGTVDTQPADDALNQAAEDLLASIQADMVEEVEKVCF